MAKKASADNPTGGGGVRQAMTGLLAKLGRPTPGDGQATADPPAKPDNARPDRPFRPLTGVKLIRELRQSLDARLTAIERKLDSLETFSHGARATYVGNNRVLMKAVVAGNQIAFFVEADDRLLSPWFIVSGFYETQLTDFFVRELRPDSHCIDVGANFGYYTCLMGRFCTAGRVVGIEADRHVFELVRDNIFVNGFHGHTTAIHAAASNHTGQMTLHRYNTRSGNTSIAKVLESVATLRGEKPSEEFTVNSLRVDDLLPLLQGRVDYMKVDVEGAEPLVLQGIGETLSANPHLTIVMEWSPRQIQVAGFDVSQFVDSIRDQGLCVSDIVPHGLAPMTFDALKASDYRTGIVLQRGTGG